MSEFLTVSNSMRAKDRDGNPKVWESQYGTFEVWNVYFENDDTKYQVNKKEGFGGYQKGEQVYGTISTNQYGGRFKQEQAPDGVTPQAAPAKASAAPAQRAQSTPSNSGVEAKLDYIISLLENGNNFRSDDAPATEPSQKGPATDDDAPIDLEELDY